MAEILVDFAKYIVWRINEFVVKDFTNTNGCCFAYFNGHLIFVDLLNNDVQYTGAQQILIKPQLTKFKKKSLKRQEAKYKQYKYSTI